MRYVVLLRAINVGGKAKVAMADLREVFEALGCEDVRTYINSGNVLVRDPRSAAELAAAAEAAIEARFGFPVAVVVRDGEQLRALCEAIPPEWTNDDEHRTDVIFLRPEADREDLLDEVEVRPGVEDVLHVAGALVWHVMRADVNRSGLRKLVGTELYRQLTIRNVNTVRRLLEMNIDS